MKEFTFHCYKNFWTWENYKVSIFRHNLELNCAEQKFCLIISFIIKGFFLYFREIKRLLNKAI